MRMCGVGVWGKVMDRLWAPWRAQYVKEPKQPTGSTNGCFICDGLAAESDRANLIALRRPNTVVVLNRFPYNNGHLLVAPRPHIGSLLELHGTELVEPLETIQILIQAMDRMMKPHGYNIGLNLGRAAGAGLPGHLHWHIVPRWDGDSNFMPVVSNTKVLIESLDEFHAELVRELESFFPVT